MKILNLKFILSTIFVSILIAGSYSCSYTFTGISIPTTVTTFYVKPFEVQALNAEPVLSQTFSDALRDKIQIESRLNQSETDPHVEFEGTITRFDVNSVAPQPGETTAFNRLNVSVSVNFTNNKDESQNWKQTFSYFSDFASSDNFLTIQDELIKTINDQLVEDIFNKAFTNW